MSDTPFDVGQAHRWFAIECNNRAWDLVDARERSEADVVRMLDAAHAAAYHWSQAGGVVERMRAESLLATAYVAAGRAEPAVHHAEAALGTLKAVTEAATAFDRAVAHACAAAAYRLARCDEHATRQRELADEAADMLDADDRPVFDQLYPWA